MWEIFKIVLHRFLRVPVWGRSPLRSFRSGAAFSVMAQESVREADGAAAQVAPRKLTGRQFYESIGSPKYVVAPMVDRSEFVCSPHVPQLSSKSWTNI